jgi:hypothetical protein
MSRGRGRKSRQKHVEQVYKRNLHLLSITLSLPNRMIVVVEVDALSSDVVRLVTVLAVGHACMSSEL